MDKTDALPAIDEGIRLWWRAIGAASRFAHHQTDIEWVSSEGHAGPERIFNVRLSPEAAPLRLDEIAAAMKSGDMPGGMILTPLSTPGNIVDLLRRRGLHIDDTSPCMALETEFVRPAPVERRIAVREVRNEGTLGDWAGVVNTGLFRCELFSLRQYIDMYRLGNTRFYLAYWEGLPASACMTVHGDNVATLECVATLPEFRRRGLAFAAVSLALEDLREHGVKIATLRSEPDGVKLYQKLGFAEYCRRVVASIG